MRCQSAALGAMQRFGRTLSTAAGAKQLRVVTVLGSTRTEGPPFPAPLGNGVGKWVTRAAAQNGFQVDVVDPIAADLPLLKRPHFAYGPGKAPAVLDDLSALLKAADCYIFCTPEYNHLPSPALLNLLNHFGASTFAFKPSAVVSYSAGQWGGTRAAVGLRTALLELGCLPVSAMIHVPTAGAAFDKDGNVKGDEAAAKNWDKYAARTLDQLYWWAEAAKNHKLVQDPNGKSPAFTSRPQQRNAP